MTEPHPATLPEARLLADCEIQRTRRSGPGGQHRNKVESAVVILHRPTGVLAEASERRSQAENRQVALFRLRVNLALAVRRPVVEGSPPSPLWRSRCQGGRIAVNPQHDDFPSLLAEALDVLTACNLEPKTAAAALGCTSSQLTKFLQVEPQALLLINRSRERLGWHRLK
ncbi:MAG: peptide chain release factor family protein [Planctomycetales bacterium]